MSDGRFLFDSVGRLFAARLSNLQPCLKVLDRELVSRVPRGLYQDIFAMNKEDEDRQIRETRSLLQKAGQRNASYETVSYDVFPSVLPSFD